MASWHGIAQSRISHKVTMQKKEKWKELVDSKKDPPLNESSTISRRAKSTAIGRADCTFKREMCAAFSRNKIQLQKKDDVIKIQLFVFKVAATDGSY
jgi:hypothetical protein